MCTIDHTIKLKSSLTVNNANSQETRPKIIIQQNDKFTPVGLYALRRSLVDKPLGKRSTAHPIQHYNGHGLTRQQVESCTRHPQSKQN